MRTHSAVILMGCLAATLAAPALAAEQNVLREIRVEEVAGGARVAVAGSKPPVFTVFRLSGPDRLVVDVAGADASAVKGPRDGKGPISGLTVSQFTDSSTSVARVLVALKGEKTYDVKADGNAVLITVLGPSPDAPAVAKTMQPAAAPSSAAPVVVPAPTTASASSSSTRPGRACSSTPRTSSC